MIDEFGGDFFQWLRGFYFVAKTGSVTRAAEAMRRNQPAISHQIKCLEEHFGIMLFNRSKGTMELTSEGQVILAKVISVFELIEEMKEQIREDKLNVAGIIRIATAPSVILYYLPRFLMEFEISYPHVRFDIQAGDVELTMASIEAAAVDFGITSLIDIPDDMIAFDLFETDLRLITALNHPLSREGNITLEAISRAPYISLPPASTITSVIEKRFAQNGLNLNTILIFNNYEIVKKYVELGFGVAILDDFAVTSEDRKRLLIFDLDKFFGKREYQIVLRKKKYLNPAVRTFLRMLSPRFSLHWVSSGQKGDRQ